MSHMEQATLEYARACNQMLDEADRRLADIIADTEAVQRNSSRILDAALRERISDLMKSCASTSASIAERRGSIGTTAYREEIDRTRQFLTQVNRVVLQSEALNSAVRAAFDAKMSERGLREGFEEYLSGIGDPQLRSVVELISRNKAHDSLSNEELKELAESIIDPSKKVRRKLIKDTVSSIESEMKSEKISPEVIRDAMGDGEAVSPLELKDRATSEILDERLRRSAVQAIVKSITARGFIVERSDIRHLKNEEGDTVKITARKPAGQVAEFRIDLDGKFVYHFQGYEGKACEKDISPLERDLEEVYGIKLTARKTLWENPDRLQNKHHQEMRTQGGH